MRIQENWGISAARAEAFFASQEGVICHPEGFSYRSCTICLKALPPEPFRKFPIPRTLVTIEGEDADARYIHRQFWLRFLSSGG